MDGSLAYLGGAEPIRAVMQGQHARWALRTMSYIVALIWCGCAQTESSLHRPPEAYQEIPMTFDERYASVQQRLASLKSELPPVARYQPLRTPNEWVTVVDRHLTMHSLRHRINSEAASGRVGVLEYAEVSSLANTPIQWKAISPPIFNSGYISLLPTSTGWLGLTLGMGAPSDDALRLQSFSILGFPVETGAGSSPLILGVRVSAGFRAAASSGGSIYVLSQRWFPPPAAPSAVPLELHRFEGGRLVAVAVPVPSTDGPGIYPADAAIELDRAGYVHIVYGTCEPRASACHTYLKQVTFGPGGQLIHSRELTTVPFAPKLMRIISTPQGRLHALIVGTPHEVGGVNEAAIVPLHADAVGHGRTEYFFVDVFLRLHAVVAENDSFRYVSPSEVHR